MKRVKKEMIFIFLFAFILLLPCFQSDADDQALLTQVIDGKEYSYYQDDTGEYYYVLRDGKVHIFQYLGKLNGTFLVPQQIDGHPVAGLGCYGVPVFQNTSGKSLSVTIPEGVTEISDYAFAALETLRQVQLPSTIKKIGAYAFIGCLELKQITLPDSLAELGEGAFYGCRSLTKVVIGKGLHIVQKNTFAGCTRLAQAIIPKNVKKVSKTAFQGCSQMKVYTADDSKVPAIDRVLMAPEVKLAKASAAMVKFVWKQEKGATGYEIWRSASASGKYRKIRALNGKSKTFTDSKLSKTKRYYYKVRSVRKEKGKKTYSKFTQPIMREKLKVNLNNSSRYGGSFTEPMKRQLEDVLIFLSTVCSGKEFKPLYKLEFLQLFYQLEVAYSMNASHYYDAWGALVNRKASCYGYSYGTLAFCDQVGIPCKIVRPNSKSVNPNHMWNTVKLGGTWYILDTQSNAESPAWYSFLVSGKTYKATGMKWDEKKYPKCPKDFLR